MHAQTSTTKGSRSNCVRLDARARYAIIKDRRWWTEAHTETMRSSRAAQGVSQERNAGADAILKEDRPDSQRFLKAEKRTETSVTCLRQAQTDYTLLRES